MNDTNNTKPEFPPPTPGRSKLGLQLQALNKAVSRLDGEAEVREMADDLELFLQNRSRRNLSNSSLL